MTTLAAPRLRPAFLRRRNPLLVGAAFCLLTGALVEFSDHAICEHRARTLVDAMGLDVIAMDREPRLHCRPFTRGWTFVATKDGHLIAGGVCAGLNTGGAIVVTLPALR